MEWGSSSTCRVSDSVGSRSAPARRTQWIVPLAGTCSASAVSPGSCEEKICGRVAQHRAVVIFAERIVESKTRHGRRATPEYNSWAGIVQRCTNPRSPRYGDYGGRGIAICAAWRADFAQFLLDMGQRPTPRHSVERLDVDGPYAPHNCVWATVVQQANNTRSNRIITARGRTMTLSEWARATGMDRRKIAKRIVRGWSVERALGI